MAEIKAGTPVPSSIVEVGTRLSSIIEKIGGLKQSSKIASVTPEQVAKWRDGKARMPLAAAAALAAAGECSLDWLAFGGDQSQSANILDAKNDMDRDGYVYIPRYDLKASAGRGALVDEENIVDYMAFREEWVRSRLHADAKDLALLEADGDSMEPTIESGDLLLVDRSITSFQNDAIYIIGRGDQLIVKRLHSLQSGVIVIMSDNDTYPPETLTLQEAGALRIAARLRWFGRMI